jgi:hypothetical protein
MNCLLCQAQNPGDVGKLYRRAGNLQQAREHLATATTMMREMQIGVWLEKAEAALKDLG